MLEVGSSTTNSIEKWGYYHEFGDTDKLYVALRSTPTHHHFDPERIRFPAIRGKRIEKATYTQATLPGFAAPQPFAIGPIVLTDRIDKQVAYFTFGGLLEVVKGTETTICTFTSDMPIFPLVTNHIDIGGEFVNETIALLARLRARYSMSYNEAEWEEKISRLSAQELYKGTIMSLFDKYKKYPMLQKVYPEFYQDLRDRLILQAQNSPSLEQLLNL